MRLAHLLLAVLLLGAFSAPGWAQAMPCCADAAGAQPGAMAPMMPLAMMGDTMADTAARPMHHHHDAGMPQAEAASTTGAQSPGLDMMQPAAWQVSAPAHFHPSGPDNSTPQSCKQSCVVMSAALPTRSALPTRVQAVLRYALPRTTVPLQRIAGPDPHPPRLTATL